MMDLLGTFASPRWLHVAEAGTLALASSLWHAALLLAVVSLALRLLPQVAAAARSLVWTAVLGLMLLEPFWPQHFLAQAASVHSASGVLPSHVLRIEPGVSLAIVGLWTAISLFRLVRLLAGMVGLRRVWARATPVQGAARLQVQAAFRASRRAELCTSGDVSRPGVLGFFAPRVLIPEALYGRLSEPELAQVLLHEAEHLRRWDDWRNLLQKLALALLPLNPFVALVERRLCLERELACDESVVLATRAPKSYAACLLRLAEERGLRRPVALVLSAWERRPELARRVAGILASRGQTALPAHRGALVTSALLAGTIALSSITAHAPALIVFTGAPSSAAAPSNVATPSDAAVLSQTSASLLTGNTVTSSAASFTPAAFRMPAAQQHVPQAHMVKTLMRLPAVSAPQTHAVSAPRRVKHRATPAALLAADWLVQERRPVAEDAPVSLRFSRVTFAVYDTANGFQIVSTMAAFPAAGEVVFLQL